MDSGKHHDNRPDSALRVNAGVEQPKPVNEAAAARYSRHVRKLHSVREYLDGISRGNRTMLSKAITLVESSLKEHEQLAQEIISGCILKAGNSVRIGITGVPGVGKSTFIEAFGRYLTSIGHKVAILAIDPSSSRSKGSILGDKTRMEELSADPHAFIRPSPSSGSLGGVARKTRETIVLCEAAGFDVVLVETVGVGQSETLVHSMVDFFLLLMLAGAGDELQGIKRGIMEMADGIVINKADGDNIDRVNLSLAEIRNVLHYIAPPPSGWNPVAMPCSALTRKGIPEVWEMVSSYVESTRQSGYFDHRRSEQSLQIMRHLLEQGLLEHFYGNAEIRRILHKMETELIQGRISAYPAARELLEKYFGK